MVEPLRLRQSKPLRLPTSTETLGDDTGRLSRKRATEENVYYEKNERGFVVRGVRPSKASKVTSTNKRTPGMLSPHASNRDLEIELADHLHPLGNMEELNLDIDRSLINAPPQRSREVSVDDLVQRTEHPSRQKMLTNLSANHGKSQISQQRSESPLPRHTIHESK